MTIIKKNLFTAERICFPEKTGKIKYWVDVTDQQIEIKMYSNEPVGGGETADIVILWDIIKLSELQKKPGFVDQTLWSRVSTDVLCVQTDSEVPFVYYPLDLHESGLVDMFAETIIAKPKSLSKAATVNLYTIFVQDSSDFNSCVIRLLFDAKYEPGFEVEGPAASSFIDEHINFEDLIAPITLSSSQTTVSTDSSITVNVTTEPYIDEIFLEQVYGILNKARVKLINGQGTFNILTDGLQPGEEIRVKAGHKKWTGIATFSKEIS